MAVRPPKGAFMATLAPTDQQTAALAGHDPEAPVVMVNLLRFVGQTAAGSVADGMSGAEAYQEYTRRVAGLADAFSGEVVFAGPGQGTVIGPEDERWDYVLIVRYPALKGFFALISDQRYQEVAPWRAAALEDSRLFAFEG